MHGKVLDVASRYATKGSPHFGKSVAVELSADNKWQLFVPKGFAHGFVVLSEQATFAYKCDNYYKASHDSGVAFNDPHLEIDWILQPADFLLSDKDLKQPAFENATYFDYAINLYQ